MRNLSLTEKYKNVSICYVAYYIIEFGFIVVNVILALMNIWKKVSWKIIEPPTKSFLWSIFRSYLIWHCGIVLLVLLYGALSPSHLFTCSDFPKKVPPIANRDVTRMVSLFFIFFSSTVILSRLSIFIFIKITI